VFLLLTKPDCLGQVPTRTGILRVHFNRFLEKGNSLYAEISAVLEKARSSAYRAINLAMVQAYWRIGYLIVEHEQEGKERAEYGKALLKELSGRLSSEFGKGFDVTNLRKMRQFYLLFSKRDAVRLKSDKTNRDAVRPDSMEIGKPHSLRGELSWTHYRMLLKTENALISHLQDFLLELGTGFAFVGRQKRLSLDGDHFYPDLVFYHIKLKFLCIEFSINLDS